MIKDLILSYYGNIFHVIVAFSLWAYNQLLEIIAKVSFVAAKGLVNRVILT